MTTEGILRYPTVFLLGLLVAYFVTPLAMKLGTKLGFVDQPGARRLHSEPIPRSGGISVFLGFHLVAFLLITGTLGENLPGTLDYSWWKLFAPVSLLLFVVGLTDDARDLGWFYKLIFQIISAAIMFWGGCRVGVIKGMTLPVSIDFVLTLAWFVILTNAFNLIDGMDGLAAGLGTVAALGLAGAAVFSNVPGDALVLLGLAGACLGFLRYNFHPARVFLGDAGSLFIGFTIASVGLTTSSKGTAIAAIGVPLLAAGVPLFDTLLAIWRRSVRAYLDNRSPVRGKGSVMQADMEHLHHRLIRAGLNQRRVALLLYTVNACLVTVGLLSIVFNSQAAGIFLLAFVMGVYVIVKHVASVELWDSGNAILKGLRRPTMMNLASLLYPIFDVLALGVAFTVAVHLVSPIDSLSQFKDVLLRESPLWCGLSFIGLVFVGTYSRVWSRARISDFVPLALVLVGTTGLSLGMVLIGYESELRPLILQAVVYLTISIELVCAMRALPRAIEDVMSEKSLAERKRGGKSGRKLLIYGAGARALLYIKLLGRKFSRSEGEMPIIVGYIDDDLNLRKRRVHGFRVLGESRELASIVRFNQIDELVIACTLSLARLQRLIEVCQHHDVAVKQYSFVERELLAEPDTTHYAPDANKPSADISTESRLGQRAIV